jgi:hypothetical protein
MLGKCAAFWVIPMVFRKTLPEFCRYFIIDAENVSD